MRVGPSLALGKRFLNALKFRTIFFKWDTNVSLNSCLVTQFEIWLQYDLMCRL